MDPDFPLPYAGDGILLDAVTPAAIDVLVGTFVGSPLLHVEIRHLGGALLSSSPEHGCLETVEQPFLLFTFGLAADAAMKDAVEHHVELVLDRLGPFDSGRRYLNFTESRVDPSAFYADEAYARLRELRAQYDPGELFAANHPIPPANRPG